MHRPALAVAALSLVVAGCPNMPPLPGTTGGGSGSAGSTGAGGGTGTGGNSGSGRLGLISGSRLKVVTAAGADGSKQGIVFYDTQLQMLCMPSPLRIDYSRQNAFCLPLAAYTEDGYFTDPQCMNQRQLTSSSVNISWTSSTALGFSWAGDAGAYLYDRVAFLADGGFANIANLQPQSGPVYYRTADGGCRWDSPSAPYYTATLSPAANPFLEMTLQLE